MSLQGDAWHYLVDIDPLDKNICIFCTGTRTSHYGVINWTTGETVYAINYLTGVDDRPILGTCWHYDQHLRDRTLVDIRIGKPIATPDDVQSVDAIYFNAAPTLNRPSPWLTTLGHPWSTPFRSSYNIIVNIA
jgi:1-acyl-sn-glycerol-3-phosphate acyltransferase